MGHVDMQSVAALWQTMRFVPANVVLSNLNSPVSSVLLCTEYLSSTAASHVPDPINPNRWYIVLVLRSGLRLRLQVVPSASHLACVKVDLLPSTPGRSSPNPRDLFWLVLDLQNPNIVVMDVLDVLIKNGLHQYSFTAGGRGYRYWIRSVVFHLEYSGVLQTGSRDLVDDVIVKRWWRGQPIGYSPVVPGTFYACYGCEMRQPQHCDHEQTYPWAIGGMRRRKDQI